MQTTVEIDNVEYASGVSDGALEAIDAGTDDGHDGGLYFADAMDARTIAWTFDYAAKHPEDEYIRNKVEGLRSINEAYRKRHGKNIPGYDEKYFAAAD